MAGNATAANALFQKYLNGELPEELLRISRSWVQEEQACAPNSLEGASIGGTDPHAMAFAKNSALRGALASGPTDGLPKRIGEMLAKSRELMKDAKGLE